MSRNGKYITPYLTREYIAMEQERRKQRSQTQIVQENRHLGWLSGILGILITLIGWMLWRK